MIELNKIYFQDCLEGMKLIDDKSIDMILCDLPYGTTTCKWDVIIPFDKLWFQYKRIIKENAAIILTATQPFTSLLINSNLDLFKYELIWEKDRPSNPLIANKRIMPRHENILIFYKKQPKFYPQKEIRKEKDKRNNIKDCSHATDTKGNINLITSIGNSSHVHPSSIIKDMGRGNGLHPTQKPIKLFEYLIKTYTDEGNLVLDNCIGSGTTALACINLKRNFIGFESNEEYYKIACNRIRQND